METWKARRDANIVVTIDVRSCHVYTCGRLTGARHGGVPGILRTEHPASIHWQRRGQRLHVDPELDRVSSVYRYCSIGEALSLVRHGKISFAHPTSWKDKFEHEVQSTIFGTGRRFAHRN